jgi:hypothetical protein
MRGILSVLIVFEVLFMAGTVYLGCVASDAINTNSHVVAGLLASVFTMFVHCLVMFYLIGSGKDIKSAVEDFADLQAEYLPLTKKMKALVFPMASQAVVLTLIAAFAGAWIHSEVLAQSRPSEQFFPLRQLPGWWIHAVTLLPALVVNVIAFRREVQAVRLNVTTIRRLNAHLEALAEGGATSE